MSTPKTMLWLWCRFTLLCSKSTKQKAHSVGKHKAQNGCYLICQSCQYFLNLRGLHKNVLFQTQHGIGSANFKCLLPPDEMRNNTEFAVFKHPETWTEDRPEWSCTCIYLSTQGEEDEEDNNEKQLQSVTLVIVQMHKLLAAEFREMGFGCNFASGLCKMKASDHTAHGVRLTVERTCRPEVEVPGAQGGCQSNWKLCNQSIKLGNQFEKFVAIKCNAHTPFLNSQQRG